MFLRTKKYRSTLTFPHEHRSGPCVSCGHSKVTKTYYTIKSTSTEVPDEVGEFALGQFPIKLEVATQTASFGGSN